MPTGTPFVAGGVPTSQATDAELAAAIAGLSTVYAALAGATFTGPVLIPAGTVGAPGLAFSADADGTGTGLYRSAVDNLSVATNGVLRATFTTAGVTLVGAALVSGGSLTVGGGVTAGDAQAYQTVIGGVGPGSASGITFQNGEAGSNLYRSTTGTVKTDGAFVIGGATLTLADACNLVFNTSTGTKIGTANTQKIGFWNATPVVQPSAYTQTYSTVSRTVAAPTSGTLTDNSAGAANTTLEALTSGSVYSTDVAAIRNNFADLAAMCNKLTADYLVAIKLIGSLIDDHQATGLCA